MARRTAYAYTRGGRPARRVSRIHGPPRSGEASTKATKAVKFSAGPRSVGCLRVWAVRPKMLHGKIDTPQGRSLAHGTKCPHFSANYRPSAPSDRAHRIRANGLRDRRSADKGAVLGFDRLGERRRHGQRASNRSSEVAESWGSARRRRGSTRSAPGRAHFSSRGTRARGSERLTVVAGGSARLGHPRLS